MNIEQIKVGPMAVFCYILSCPEKKEAILIDPGGDEKSIIERLNKQKLHLNYIVNTHFHSDHSCGNAAIKETTNAKILLHETDNQFLDNELVKQMTIQMGFKPSPGADVTVKDGDEITVGSSIRLKVIHTPGHSPGGMCLFSDGNLFTGDTLFVGNVGRCDIPGGNQSQLIQSIRNKLLILPDETIIWPGHDYGPAPTSKISLERILY